LKFEIANDDWLDFVVKNSNQSFFKTSDDLVIGPVANDRVLPVINAYMDDVYTEDEAVKRLLPQNLTDQYALLTSKTLELLIFQGSKFL